MSVMNLERAGMIALGKTVDVTDPCYRKGVWCRKTVQNIEPGRYGCYFARDPKYHRVSRCRIVLEDGAYAETAKEKVTAGKSWRMEDTICVDAAMAGFFADKPDFGEEEWDNLCDNMDSGTIAVGKPISEFAYPDAFLASKENGFAFSNDTDGFWTSSGYGDGRYPFFVIRNKKHQIIALELRFID